MSKNKNSDLKLAAVGGLAAVLASFMTAIAGSLFVDADTERTTNVQLIQVAVSLLSKEEKKDSIAGDRVLREWAVDTINETAKVKFDENAKRLLVEGEIRLSQSRISESAIRLVAGGGLFALPIVFNEMQTTIEDGSSVSAAPLNKPNFNNK